MKPFRTHSREAIRDAVAASTSATEALRRLGLRPAGGNFATLKRYVEHFGISTAHFAGTAGPRGGRAARPLDEVLVAGSDYHRGNLKRRLFAEGLKERRCESCGQGEEWQGRRLALILDHVNGVANDNRLENLQIVCPNCAATLDTHCGRNKPKRCVGCGESFRPAHGATRHCSRRCANASPASRSGHRAQRVVTRPPRARLLAEIHADGYSAVGRRYGVSDNAIRKWVRAYEREAQAEGEDAPEPAAQRRFCMKKTRSPGRLEE
jgi:transposase-like protein